MVRLEIDEYPGNKIFMIKESFASVAVEYGENWYGKRSEPEGTWMNFGSVPKLGEAKSSPWKFEATFGAWRGLHGEQAQTGEFVRVAFETLFGHWVVRNAVHLPPIMVQFLKRSLLRAYTKTSAPR